MSLYLSGVLGGPELEKMPFYRIVQLLDVIRLGCEDDILPKGGGSLSLIHRFPGTIWQPEFQGTKLGHVLTKKKRLQIEIAVPADAIISRDFGSFYLDSLEEAIRLAKERFDKKSIPFSVEKYLELIGRMRNGLQDIDRQVWGKN